MYRIASYNPSESESNVRTIRLSQNEELIGIYGYYGSSKDYFKSFGFVVKVNPAN